MKDSGLFTVITLTKNRAQLLDKCLGALTGQLLPADEIILVDNNATDNTPAVIRKYQKRLPLRVYRTSISGYASLYNFAIAKSKNEILVFLDDDCVATPSFISRIREKYKRKRNFVLQGKTLSIPPDNIYSEISGDHLANWMSSNMVGKNKLRVIDNRNVVIPKSIIKRLGGFSSKMEIGSEDVELGVRLFRFGISIDYDSSVVVAHHERTTLKEFLFQHYRIAQSHAILDKKFSKNQNISIINRGTFMRHVISSLKRELEYLYTGRYRDVFLLPYIYLLLLIVRIIGYLDGLHTVRREAGVYE